MKKIVSLLLAVLLVSAAFAQVNMRSERSKLFKNTYVKKARTTASSTLTTSPRAAKSTYDYTASLFYATPYDAEGNPIYDETTPVNDWYLVLTDNETFAFNFDIVVSDLEDITYTLDDMDVEFSYGRVAAAGATELTNIEYASASITITYSNETDFTVEAQVTDSETGDIYNINYSYVAPTFDDADGTVTIDIPNASFSDYSSVDGDYYFDGYTTDSTYFVQIDYYATTVEGTHTNIYADYTRVFINPTQDDYTRVSTVLANIEVTRDGDNYNVAANLLGEDNILYQVTMTYAIPVATDTIDVVISDAVYNEVAGYYGNTNTYTWTGSTDDYDVNIVYYGETSEGDVPFIYLDSENSSINGQAFVDGHLNTVATENGYDLVAYLVGEDLHCYHITMTYVVPTMADAIDTITIVVPQAELTDLITNLGAFQMLGYDANHQNYAALTIYTDQIPGSYTFADFWTDYTVVYYDEVRIPIVDGHATATATADGYEMEAYMLGNNRHCYHVFFTYTIPVANDTVEVMVSNGAFSDFSGLDGSYMFSGTSDDELYTFKFNYFSSIIDGTFTMDDVDEDYTYLYENDTKLSIYTAEFTVTTTESGYTVDAYILCTNNHCYHVTLNAPLAGINTVNSVVVKLYPNPTTEVLHIEAEGINRVDVIDMAGHTVLVNNQVNGTINVSTLANGIYMIRTTTNEGVNIQKFIKK